MFSSCAELTITGDSKMKSQMNAALSLVMDGFNFKPVAFRMSQDGRAVLYEAMPAEKYRDGLIEISSENRSVGFVAALVEVYLISANYNKAIHNIPKEEGDGSYYAGWRMTLDNYQIDDKVIIEPWWAFYHK